MAENIAVIDLSGNAIKPVDGLAHPNDSTDASTKEKRPEIKNNSWHNSKCEQEKFPIRKYESNAIAPENVQDKKGPSTEVEKGKKTNARSKSFYWWSAFHMFGILIAAIIPLSMTLLIPRDNAIFYPSSWHETAILYVFLLATLHSFLQGIDITVYTGTTSWISLGLYVRFYLLLMFGLILTCCACYFVSTIYLGNNLPTPRLWIWLNLAANILTFIGMWFLCPLELRKTAEYKQKFIIYVLYKCFMSVATPIQSEALKYGFERVPYDWQWVIAIITIMTREINHWILSKLMKKILNAGGEMVNVLLGASLSSLFGSLIAVRLVVANNVAVGSFLLVEFLLHIRVCYQVTKLYQNDESEENDFEIKTKLQKLVLDEILEVFILLVYAIGSSFAIHGPNQAIYKGLRNFEDDDTYHVFMIMFFMVAVETIGSLICGFILKKYSNVNIFKEFCDLMKHYWYVLAIRLAWTMFVYFSMSDSNLGSDYLGGYEWITDEGRRRMIMSSPDLSDKEKSLILDDTISL